MREAWRLCSFLPRTAGSEPWTTVDLLDFLFCRVDVGLHWFCEGFFDENLLRVPPTFSLTINWTCAGARTSLTRPSIINLESFRLNIIIPCSCAVMIRNRILSKSSEGISRPIFLKRSFQFGKSDPDARM